jgi:hypothetical protein
MIGMVVGALAAVITFLWVYIAAVGSVGWVIGIALGWIPAGIAAFIAFWIGRYLWWLFALLLLGVVVLVMRS